GLCLRSEAQGALSQKFKQLRAGDSVQFLGPCGGLEYVANAVKHITLVASGVGITPCLQIVRAVTSDPDDRTRTRLLYYADTRADLLFKEELDRLAGKHAGKLSIFYSVGETDDTWQGAEGFIGKEALKANLPEQQETSQKIILSGGPQMILSSLQSLFSLDRRSEDVYIYGPFGAEQIRAVYGRNAKLGSHKVLAPATGVELR
ncbi:PREDICTED: NADH-cytochrome b5 reductase 1-like, partial [Priapulus caudatus]|uniref:NADH-cytochrome b5 reductase 1-like n=1 Tax=Priapulus caudatus TaxID=37621 RepID=A0ABM1EZK6_PRICU